MGRVGPTSGTAPAETADRADVEPRPRLGADRPLRARGAQSPALVFGDDERDADGPITAPGPAVDLDEDSFESYRAPSDPRGGRDQVRIRTGQAGGIDSAAGRPAVSDKPPPDDRPSRSGLLKLRRRLQGPS